MNKKKFNRISIILCTYAFFNVINNVSTTENVNSGLGFELEKRKIVLFDPGPKQCFSDEKGILSEKFSEECLEHVNNRPKWIEAEKEYKKDVYMYEKNKLEDVKIKETGGLPSNRESDYRAEAEYLRNELGCSVLNQIEKYLKKNVKINSNNITYFDFDKERLNQCFEDLHIYFKGIEGGKIWAFMMQAATAVGVSGHFSGNGNNLGDFESCLMANKHHSPIEPEYCLLAIDLYTNNKTNPELQWFINKITGDGFIKSSDYQPGHFIARYSTLHRGICLPKSCAEKFRAESHDWRNQETFTSTDLNKKYGLFSEYQNDDLGIRTWLFPYACHKNDNQTYSFKVYATWVFLGGFCLMVVIGTITENSFSEKNQHSLKTIVIQFSTKKSISHLLAEANDAYQSIHGIRSLCTLMLYVAHRTIPLSFVNISNRSDFAEYSQSNWSTLLRSSHLYLDTFLFLSGFLACMSARKEIFDKKGPFYKKYIKFVLSRYIRLTIPLIAVLLVYAYVIEYTGDGPQWGIIVKANADLCKKNMWQNIFYVQNLYPFGEVCAPHTYHLALDMQFYVVTPLVLGIIYVIPKYVWFILICVLYQLVAYDRYIKLRELHMSVYLHHGIQVHDLYKLADTLHLRFYYRLLPFLFGLLVHECIRIILKYPITKANRINKNILILIFNMFTFCSTAFCLYGLIGDVLSFDFKSKQFLKRDDKVMEMYYAFSMPLLWLVAMAWIIFICKIKTIPGVLFQDAIKKIMHNRLFVIFSRLSYAFYLVQFIAFNYNVGSIRSTSYVKLIDLINIPELLVVLFLSFATCILFDYPTLGLKKMLPTFEVLR